MNTSSKVKVIRMLLDDGSLDGVTCIDDNSWQSGELYSAPREYVDSLIKKKEINKYGIYLLLSDKRVYVGQSSDLGVRIQQHKLGKDWWDRAIVLTTSDNHFTKTDIDYMEYVLIDEAEKNGTLDFDNKQKGNTPQIDKYEQAILNSYLEEARFLLELIGVNVFKKDINKIKRGHIEVKEKPLDPETLKMIGKKEVLLYLKSKGFNIKGSRCTYARLQERKKHPFYWANPNKSLLSEHWTLILNNQDQHKLFLLEIPSYTFQAGLERRQMEFVLRKDDKKKEAIDLEVDSETFIDKPSGIDLSKYIKKTIKY